MSTSASRSAASASIVWIYYTEAQAFELGFLARLCPGVLGREAAIPCAEGITLRRNPNNERGGRRRNLEIPECTKAGLFERFEVMAPVPEIPTYRIRWSAVCRLSRKYVRPGETTASCSNAMRTSWLPHSGTLARLFSSMEITVSAKIG